MTALEPALVQCRWRQHAARSRTRRFGHRGSCRWRRDTRHFQDAARGLQPRTIPARYRTVSAFTPPEVLATASAERCDYSAGSPARASRRSMTRLAGMTAVTVGWFGRLGRYCGDGSALDGVASRDFLGRQWRAASGCWVVYRGYSERREVWSAVLRTTCSEGTSAIDEPAILPATAAGLLSSP